jgi:hypothetical protein
MARGIQHPHRFLVPARSRDESKKTCSATHAVTSDWTQGADATLDDRYSIFTASTCAALQSRRTTPIQGTGRNNGGFLFAVGASQIDDANEDYFRRAKDNDGVYQSGCSVQTDYVSESKQSVCEALFDSRRPKRVVRCRKRRQNDTRPGHDLPYRSGNSFRFLFTTT